jgi:RNA polymerase sigma-70 factor (ECF subfamily)
MAADEDRVLVAECLEGRTERFALLVSRYQKTLFNTALRMVNDYDDAQEITQAAFVKAFEKLETYRPEYKFFSWLYRIAMNEAINHINQSRKKVAVDPDMASSASNPAENYESKELSLLVQSAIGELSIDYRAVIVLKHFTDLSLRELAYILEIPVKTVKSRLYSARQRLCEILKKKGIWTNV